MTDAELIGLLDKRTETRNLDYKEVIDWSTAPTDEKVGLVKDILAMANTSNGGHIVLGVRDTDFAQIGLTEAAFEALDQTKVNDFLHRYTDPRFSCQVYKFSVNDRLHAVIEVSQFPEIPIICKADANSSKTGKSLLKRGSLYIRTDKATSEAVSCSEEMRELLELALTKKGSSLISTIQNLLDSQPSSVVPDRAPGEPARASSIPNLKLETT